MLREKYDFLRAEVTRLTSGQDCLTNQIQTDTSAVEKQSAIQDETREMVIAYNVEAKPAEELLKTKMKDVKERVSKGRTETAQNLTKMTEEAERRTEAAARDMEEAQTNLENEMSKDREREMKVYMNCCWLYKKRVPLSLHRNITKSRHDDPWRLQTDKAKESGHRKIVSLPGEDVERRTDRPLCLGLPKWDRNFLQIGTTYRET